jgi:hypothetical protein
MATATASGTSGLYGPPDQYHHSKVAQFIGMSLLCSLNSPTLEPEQNWAF